MKRALILGGGGARGSFQVGMLETLVIEQGLDFQVIRGVSVGALNAAFLAQAAGGDNSQPALADKVRDLKKLWLEDIKGNGSVYKKRLDVLGIALGKDSLYSLTPLRELIERRLSLEELRNSGRNFTVGTASLVSGQYQEWPPQEADFADKLLASASIPVVFPFQRFAGQREVLVDGGVRNITPFGSAFREQPDEIYILLTSRIIRSGNKLPESAAEELPYEAWEDNRLGTRIGGFDVLERTLDLLSDEIYLDDVRGALRWNNVIAAIRQLSETAGNTQSVPEKVREAIGRVGDELEKVSRRYVPLFVLAPRRWFDEENQPGKRNISTNFDPALIRKAIAHGKEIAADPSLWVWPPQ